MQEEKTLRTASPAMFRNRPVLFVLFVILSVPTMGLGLIPLGVWWVWTKGVKLIITTDRVRLNKGLLSKHTNEVYITDVRNVQVKQGILQRAFGVGRIDVASAAHGGIEISVNGIRAPEKVAALIDQERRKARAA